MKGIYEWKHSLTNNIEYFWWDNKDSSSSLLASDFIELLIRGEDYVRKHVSEYHKEIKFKLPYCYITKLED